MQVGSAVGTGQDSGTNSHKSLPGSASRVRRGGQDPKCAGASGGGDLGGDRDLQGAQQESEQTLQTAKRGAALVSSYRLDPGFQGA